MLFHLLIPEHLSMALTECHFLLLVSCVCFNWVMRWYFVVLRAIHPIKTWPHTRYTSTCVSNWLNYSHDKADSWCIMWNLFRSLLLRKISCSSINLNWTTWKVDRMICLLLVEERSEAAAFLCFLFWHHEVCIFNVVCRLFAFHKLQRRSDEEKAAERQAKPIIGGLSSDELTSWCIFYHFVSKFLRKPPNRLENVSLWTIRFSPSSKFVWCFSWGPERLTNLI